MSSDLVLVKMGNVLRSAKVFLFVSMACGDAGAASADLALHIWDGNPHDRIRVENTAACGVVTGFLHIDFTPSKARLLIDTAYGGAGTRDPMPVEVEQGAVRIAPVSDGDRAITLRLEALAAGEQAVVTLDLDDEGSFFRAPRVSVTGRDIAGTRALFDLSGVGVAQAVFDDAGRARLALDVDCSTPEDEGPFLAVPMG